MLRYSAVCQYCCYGKKKSTVTPVLLYVSSFFSVFWWPIQTQMFDTDQQSTQLQQQQQQKKKTQQSSLSNGVWIKGKKKIEGKKVSSTSSFSCYPIYKKKRIFRGHLLLSLWTLPLFQRVYEWAWVCYFSKHMGRRRCCFYVARCFFLSKAVRADIINC